MRKNRLILIVLAILIAGGIFHAQYSWIRAKADGSFCTCWIMMKPGDYVHVRRTPSKNGEIVGYMEPGDWFETDAVSSNGYLRVCDFGEYGEGWVHLGYVVTQEPNQVMAQAVCRTKSRVAIRRYMDGPKVSGNCWLVDGSTVTVFWEADGWSCTSRGFVKSEWLEVEQ